MMALGRFVFGLSTLAPQEVDRETGWRFGANSRVGARPALQFIGPDADTLSLSGLLLPQLAGDVGGLDQLREMGDTGQAFPLVDGLGRVLGAFVIKAVRDRRNEFFADGVAQRVDFGLELIRVDAPGEAAGAGGEDDDAYFFDDDFDGGDDDAGDVAP